MLESIKLRLGLTDNSKDPLICDYISDVTEDILEILNMNELPKKAESIVKDLVIIKYNLNGSEGLTSESYSGISQAFIDDIPKDIKRKIMRLRKLPKN